MKKSNELWKPALGTKISESLSNEIDEFETDIARRKSGQIDEKIFAETRLRRGTYGQRYDNGKRFDGNQSRELIYNEANPTKGVDTLWDAPGMTRIKIPFGGMTAEQSELIADLAEEYSDGIAHITTRQDYQLHFIHIENTPTIMRRLAAVGITTREACGNSVRNVTACPKAGVCDCEVFDVSAHARVMTRFFLGHHDVQDFGRKFKISFSGCKSGDCGLAGIHDLGLVARIQEVDGKSLKGFQVYAGGGLGAVPQASRLLYDFIREDELLLVSQAIARVFARLGEKKNRARARLKFLIQKLGVEKFRELVEAERKVLPPDERRSTLLAEGYSERIDMDAAGSDVGELTDEQKTFLERNAFNQKQKGFLAVRVLLPLGDITPAQLRGIADIQRKYMQGTLRLTVTQNILLRWIPLDKFKDVYNALHELGLTSTGSDTISDVVACPGTDTCKLGIASSRGLASELRSRFLSGEFSDDPQTRDLQIKISGCFNSCSQHHIADLGFYGISRKVGGHTVPHFQVVLGGVRTDNASEFGMPILAIPAKRIPEVVKHLLSDFKKEKNSNETFQDYIHRTGKAEIKTRLQPYTKVEDFQSSPQSYTDWGDVRVHSTKDMGIGECAGEVIARIDFDFGTAEREVFEAQLALDASDYNKAGQLAFQSMMSAARGLIKLSFLDISKKPDQVKKEFDERLVATGLFTDPYMGNKFANYFLDAQDHSNYEKDSAHQLIEEAGLFIEAAHSCYARNGDKLERIEASGVA